MLCFRITAIISDIIFKADVTEPLIRPLTAALVFNRLLGLGPCGPTQMFRVLGRSGNSFAEGNIIGKDEEVVIQSS